MGAGIIGLLMLQAASAPATVGVDPLAVFSGDWQIANSDTGEILLDCTQGQRFTVAPDRRSVELTELSAADQRIRYLVLRSETNRILMFIETEERLTSMGDPILWWAHFDGPDRFRWRQYGWSPDSGTAAEWRRCPRR